MQKASNANKKQLADGHRRSNRRFIMSSTLFETMSKKYSTVEFEGKTYALTQDAFVDNYGTNGDVCYRAMAIDEQGNKYNVIWYLDEAYEKNGKDYNRYIKLTDLSEHQPLDDDEQSEFDTLIDDGQPSPNEDESNACDWDEPAHITFYEEAE